MAKKQTSRTTKLDPVFSLGDRVEIIHFGQGKIIELRGPLGPGGAQVYRVLYCRKPRPRYIEVLGSQLRPVKKAPRRKPAGGKVPNLAGATDGTEARNGE